jgi:hypothetical protein
LSSNRWKSELRTALDAMRCSLFCIWRDIPDALLHNLINLFNYRCVVGIKDASMQTLLTVWNFIALTSFYVWIKKKQHYII